MILQKALLLFHFSLAIGLSLDNLSHRAEIPSSGRFNHYDRADESFEEDFLRRGGTKRRMDHALTEYRPKSSAFSKDIASHESLWDKPYPPLRSFREQVKRETKSQQDTAKGKEEQELASILQDDESENTSISRDRKVPPDAKRKASGSKKKRESETQPEELPPAKEPKEDHESPEFQEWLRKEYYRNMAKSFASMRRKRAMWGPIEPEEKLLEHRRMTSVARSASKSRQDDVRFEDVTDNLKSIENALLADALKVIKDNGGDFGEDYKVRRRVTNDLNAAYDIETMRGALFRLRDTFYGMEDDDVDSEDLAAFRKYKKRASQLDVLPFSSHDSRDYRSAADQCPPLAVLTSDCAALGDAVPDDTFKELLAHACNWHEVCYSCGELFGLSSDNCDAGFVEQSRTICRGDFPCESTAKLLLLPLRQRRVFFKRSNPNVCLVDQCVEDFLTRG